MNEKLSTILGLASIVLAGWGPMYYFSNSEDKEAIENHKAALTHSEARSNLAQQRIENLEKTLLETKLLNKVYFAELSQNPSSLIVIKEKIEKSIKDTVSNSEGFYIAKEINTEDAGEGRKLSEALKYPKIFTLERGEAYFDSNLNLTIGLNKINSDYEADIQLTLPGQKSKNLTIKSGFNESFSFESKEYMILCKSLDYITNKAEFEIHISNSRN